MWSDYYHLLQFVKSRYDHIVVDFPEVINEASIEIVNRSKYVFVVCTPEMPALKLTQRRCQSLTDAGVPAGKIGIIVNRWHDTDVSEAEIEAMLQHGIAGVFPNDYQSVNKAMQDHGAFVDRSTVLGKTFVSFARLLAGVPELEEPQARRSRFAFLKGVKIVWPNK
jgi:Flp pilus assembly CpaE family ATPase